MRLRPRYAHRRVQRGDDRVRERLRCRPQRPVAALHQDDVSPQRGHERDEGEPPRVRVRDAQRGKHGDPPAAVVLIPGAPHTLVNLPAARYATEGFVREVPLR